MDLGRLLAAVEKPSRYLGLELNSVHKPASRVSARAALAFPDLYEVGMSHLGTQILYGLGNQVDGVQVERAFLPAEDMLAALAGAQLPLFTLESRTPLAKCDLVGFTLQSELTYTNILAMLDAAGIPRRSARRREGHPVVIAGGPCVFNPAPLAPFIDLFLLGDGERQWPRILEILKEAAGREERLARIRDEVPGIYDPSEFPETYDREGRLKPPAAGRSAGAVPRAPVVPIDRQLPASSFLVPFLQTVHDRINIEVTRGCTRGCRFCAAGMVYRPVRERPADSVFRLAADALACTGYEDLSLNSLSVGDYGPLDEVLTGLMDRHAGERVALSLPSMRVGSLTPEVARQIRRVRKTGFTIAPEAGTQRLRNVINKDISDAEIRQTTRWVFSQGWQAVKLYFMVGLPTETDRDVVAIAELAEELAGMAPAGGKVTVNVSPFVPKAHTPFQWAAQDTEEELRRKVQLLRANLKRGKVQFRWGRTDQALLEAVLARGDARVAEAVELAYGKGAVRDGWEEHFKWDLWRQAFDECGLDPAWYASRERNADEIFPWDHVSCGVTKDFLRRERDRALAAEITPDCREAGCRGCGACTPAEAAAIPPLRVPVAAVQEDAEESVTAPTGPNGAAGPVRRVRCVFSKLGDMKFLGHLETVRAFERAARRAGLPLAFSGGYHPKARINFALSLPMGVEGESELVDLELSHSVPAARVADALNRHLPPGLKITRAWKAPLEGASLASRVDGITYRARLPRPVRGLAGKVKAVVASPSVLIERRRKGKVRSLDLKDYLLELAADDDTGLAFTLRFLGEKGSLRPQEVLEATLGDAMPPMAEVAVTRSILNLRIEKDRSGGRPGWARVWD